MFVFLENKTVEKEKEHLYMRGKRLDKMYYKLFYRSYKEHFESMENVKFFEFVDFQLNHTKERKELKDLLDSYRFELVGAFNMSFNPAFGVTDKRLEERLTYLHNVLKEPRRIKRENLKDFVNDIIVLPSEYLEDFKEAVKDLKGKGLRTAINILEEHEHLVIPPRSISRLHRTLKKELARDIDTRQAFDDSYVNGPGSMKIEYQKILNRLNSLLEKYPVKAPK